MAFYGYCVTLANIEQDGQPDPDYLFLSSWARVLPTSGGVRDFRNMEWAVGYRAQIHLAVQPGPSPTSQTQTWEFRPFLDVQGVWDPANTVRNAIRLPLGGAPFGPRQTDRVEIGVTGLVTEGEVAALLASGMNPAVIAKYVRFGFTLISSNSAPVRPDVTCTAQLFCTDPFTLDTNLAINEPI